MRARDDQLRLLLRRDRACAVDCPQRRLRAVRADDDCPIAHIAPITRLTTTRHYRAAFVFEAHWAHPAERAPGRSPHPATFCGREPVRHGVGALSRYSWFGSAGHPTSSRCWAPNPIHSQQRAPTFGRISGAVLVARLDSRDSCCGVGSAKALEIHSAGGKQTVDAALEVT